MKKPRTSERLPSLKTLRQITEKCQDDAAKLLRKLLECRSRDDTCDFICDREERLPNTFAWINKCYNIPWMNHIKLEAANEILEGFGVEHAGDVDIRKGPPLQYINFGDTYDLTLCRFNGRWVVSSWGDIVERHERLFRER